MTPTNAAMKAAEKVLELCSQDRQIEASDIAALIDRETGIGELLAACRNLSDAFEGKDDMGEMDAADFVDRAADTFNAVLAARDLLAKHGG